MLNDFIKNDFSENVIIAISGDSGVGKSTLTKLIANIFNVNSIKYECDRYHKWERKSKNWDEWTHLHPNANDLNQMKEDIYQLKIGNKIYRSDYDHSSGCFTNEEEIIPSSLIIVSGLHTLFEFDNIYNLKIFIEPDENLRVFWKIKRDHLERMYPIETILNKINLRKNDSIYITSQRNNADFIISYYTDDDLSDFKSDPNIKLKFLIKENKEIKFLTILNKLGIGYSIKNENENLFKEIMINEIFSKKSFKKSLNEFNNEFLNFEGLCEGNYGLIQIIIFLWISFINF